MRLKANKTLSQQQLAIKLRVEHEEKPGLLTWERRRLLIHAAKTALAAALCWWIAMRFGLHDGYWGAISAIIVLQSNFGATISASRDRILGNVDRRAARLFVHAVWRVAVELHSGCAGRGNCLRIAGSAQQFAAGRRDHHYRDAGENRLALDACAGSRAGGLCWASWWLMASLRWSFPIARGCGCATDWRRSFWCWELF